MPECSVNVTYALHMLKSENSFLFMPMYSLFYKSIASSSPLSSLFRMLKREIQFFLFPPNPRNLTDTFLSLPRYISFMFHPNTQNPPLLLRHGWPNSYLTSYLHSQHSFTHSLNISIRQALYENRRIELPWCRRTCPWGIQQRPTYTKKQQHYNDLEQRHAQKCLCAH